MVPSPGLEPGRPVKVYGFYTIVKDYVREQRQSTREAFR